MTDSLVELSPSTISRIIVKSRQLKSESEVLSVYSKLSEPDKGILTDEQVDDAFPDEVDIKELLSEHIPDNLKPFADALYGAVANEEKKLKDS